MSTIARGQVTIATVEDGAAGQPGAAAVYRGLFSSTAIYYNNALRRDVVKYNEEKNIPAVYEILKKGSEEAQQVAAQTLRDVRASMKINYFDDAALIKEQMEKYSK